MNGITGYGAYVPYHRLDRSTIAEALGEGGGRGQRSVASYDEDATSMAVEAARNAMGDFGGGQAPLSLFFASASPPYLDKTNATVVHAALGLDPTALAVDMCGAVRSGVGAMIAASQSADTALAVMSDVRTGLSGGADERDGGDAAAAVLFGPDTPEAPVLAEIVAVSSVTEEFLDRWRLPGSPTSRVWEERFGEGIYGELGDASLTDALKQAGLTPGDVDHLVVAGLHARANRRVAAASGVAQGVLVDDLVSSLGNPGTAQPGLLLADVLDRAEPGALIALVVLADGATTWLIRTTPALAAARSSRPVALQVAAGSAGLRYATFLAWRGLITREPPRRPDPLAPAAPPSYRSARWKYSFSGSRCTSCSTLHLPPVRVCVGCGAVDEMSIESLREVNATVATHTIDRLAFTPNPPLVNAVIDFDGGGRFSCELTDVDPNSIDIGMRVEMSFRRLVTAGGIHNYFWKARPVREEALR